MTIDWNAWRDRCHEAAKANGWHEGEPAPWPQLRFLVVSELVEAGEDYRDGHEPGSWWCECFGTPCGHDACKPEGIPVEIADAAIRLLDAAGLYGWELESGWIGLSRGEVMVWLDRIASQLYGTEPRIDASFALAEIEAFATHHGIDLEATMERKLRYNATRGHRHGGKRA